MWEACLLWSGCIFKEISMNWTLFLYAKVTSSSWFFFSYFPPVLPLVTPHLLRSNRLQQDSRLVDPSVILLNNFLPSDKKETTVIHSTHSIYKWMTYPRHFPPEHCSSSSPLLQIKRVMDSQLCHINYPYFVVLASSCARQHFYS